MVKYGRGELKNKAKMVVFIRLIHSGFPFKLWRRESHISISLFVQRYITERKKLEEHQILFCLIVSADE